MEILQDDYLNGPEDGNQALRTSDNRFDEHIFDEEEIAIIANDASSEAVAQSTSQRVTKSASRKVHSAAPSSKGYGRSDDIPRPYTAAGADAFPSNRQRKKKSATAPNKTARDGKDERPRSAGVNEWGDFDTDRLLRDDFEEPSNQMPPDPIDRQRSARTSRSRKSRRSTPVPSSPPTNPWDGYLTLTSTCSESKETSKPHRQVLRQKSIEILNLDFVTHTNQSSGRASATPKPLLSRASMERLTSSHSRPGTRHAPPLTHLFGTEIPNTPTNRAAIFGRFADLWSLISRSRFSQSESAKVVDMQTKSPMECSTVMVKLCKTVGISLTCSVATRLSFWSPNEQGVDFESFCNLVIQGAIQPALHHFNLDNSIAEYVAAVDIITQSLVTTEPTRRKEKTSPDQSRHLKQLNEIQPVFMSWKAGVTPRLIQSVEASTSTPTKFVVTAEKVRRALEASASQNMLAHQLLAEEARVTHVENIRRKVQLHKSWRCAISDNKQDEGGVFSPMTRFSRLTCNDKQRVSSSADVAEILDRARIVFSSSAGPDVIYQSEEEHPEQPCNAGAGNDPEQDIEAENEEVLVCCSCSVRVAELWCASCFTVNCQKCWQEVHCCTVDMSMVASESAAKQPLVGPTALTMRNRSGSAAQRPPVAMVYLPTKVMKPGTLAKGVRHIRNSSNQVNTVKDEIPVVAASAILPSLQKSRSTGTIPRHFDRLQLETITHSNPVMPTTLGSQTTTSIELAKRLHKHPTSRSKLLLAPVSLDAELLLPTDLRR